MTLGSEYFVSDEGTSQSPSCAGEGGAMALVSRETNRQPCRRKGLMCARRICSFPRTPTCFLREQCFFWAIGTGTTVMHCGRHPYVRRTLRVQESMKQRRMEKYRKNFRTRSHAIREAEAASMPPTRGGRDVSPFRWDSRVSHSVFHVKPDPAHGITPVAGPTEPGHYAVAPRERGSVLLKSESLLPHARSLRFDPGIPIQRRSLRRTPSP